MADPVPDDDPLRSSPPVDRAGGGEEPTVGTGSVVALGCVIASLLVTLLGAGVLVLLRLL